MSDATVHPTSEGPLGEEDLSSRTNWLRAGVLGANDGIVSTGGLVLGVAASAGRSEVLVAGLAGLVAGAMSMAVGEYVSVSTQRDTEHAALRRERQELREDPEAEREELARIYQSKGLSAGLAGQVADELMAHDALAAHAEAELGIDVESLTNPWHAAIASFVAFTVGALLPLLTAVLTTDALRVPVTFAAMLVALVVTGTLSARLGGAGRRRAVTRVVVGGAIALVVTYGIGRLVGVAV
jgi:VIT1/CCC1 family predicted Fe2+/Mn2+ transporter